jgi:hypothetical protein
MAADEQGKFVWNAFGVEQLKLCAAFGNVDDEPVPLRIGPKHFRKIVEVSPRGFSATVS